METLNDVPDQAAWHILVGAAKRAAQEKGYALIREPGRGRSNVWKTEQNGKTKRVSIRTTRDRWIAFPPLQGGKTWKTLDTVDTVIVAAVDDPASATRVEVYQFEAAEVRKRFDQAYTARAKAGQVLKDNYGMWVCLDKDERGLAASVGSGLAEERKPIAVYPVSELAPAETGEDDAGDGDLAGSETDSAGQPRTIADVMNWARERIASLSGVRTEAVKLDLKIEY
jgi:hypothetical protein